MIFKVYLSETLMRFRDLQYVNVVADSHIVKDGSLTLTRGAHYDPTSTVACFARGEWSYFQVEPENPKAAVSEYADYIGVSQVGKSTLAAAEAIIAAHAPYKSKRKKIPAARS